MKNVFDLSSDRSNVNVSYQRANCCLINLRVDIGQDIGSAFNCLNKFVEKALVV